MHAPVQGQLVSVLETLSTVSTVDRLVGRRRWVHHCLQLAVLLGRGDCFCRALSAPRPPATGPVRAEALTMEPSRPTEGSGRPVAGTSACRPIRTGELAWQHQPRNPLNRGLSNDRPGGPGQYSRFFFWPNVPCRVPGTFPVMPACSVGILASSGSTVPRARIYAADTTYT